MNFQLIFFLFHSFLDREKQEVYNLIVVATDGGKSIVRTEYSEVKIALEDMNDNFPIFENYPYIAKISQAAQPGQIILKLFAKDADLGINGEVLYDLVPNKFSDLFRLDLNSGVLTVAKSLTEFNGQTIFLEIISRDKGFPTRKSTNFVELTVGEKVIKTDHLFKFTNTSYVVSVRNGINDYPLYTLQAYTQDQRAEVSYEIVNGNIDGVFNLNQRTGDLSMTRFEDSKLKQKYTLGIMAKTNGGLYAYSTIDVVLHNQYNRAPRFTQPQYSAIITEGRSKGTFVTRVKANDFADTESNTRLLYHIVDGNHDNAFVVEPAVSGIVKTNIVLDREIRDFYQVKIIATNVEAPQLTGTTTLLVRVLDIDDNKPSFPQSNLISVSEGEDFFV